MVRIPSAERFDKHVEQIPFSDCWHWVGYIRPNGYGRFMVAAGKPVYAHRFAWERSNGPIPDGLVIDHLCRNRGCVNPAHMEAVTQGENLKRSSITMTSINMRRTTCNSGHPFDTVSYEGYRKCNRCRRERRAAARKRRSA